VFNIKISKVFNYEEFIIFFTFFLLVTSHLIAENIKLPPKIDPFQYLVPKGIIYNYSHPYNEIYLFPDVRIWGWSSTGKVAYSIENIIEGKGGILIQYTVLDTITDDIVFNLKMDSNDYGIDESNENIIEIIYTNEMEKIMNSMKYNNIIEQYSDFLSFPIKIGINEFNCYAKIENEIKPEFWDTILRYEVIANRNGKSKIIKTVLEVSALSIYICGYFKSPFENRILVVIAEEQWGFEGKELSYNFSGCHLEIGFN
jgi:hypothetical protein